MARYPDEFIEQIKQKIDIVDLIGNYVSVERKGRDYWACCPFHSEKTPSFQIRADNQFYHCYGCSKSGDIFKFIMEYEKIGFNEAVEALANRAGLELPQLSVDPQVIQRKELLDKVYNINRDAAIFYYKNLLSENGNVAREYLHNRQISINIIKTFGIGFSSDFSSLPKYLLGKGYSKKSLIDAGIISLSKSGEPIDFFGKRIVIPIIGGNGKILGFSGRVLEAKPDFAKYKNTSTTVAFNKRKNLFAINLFKKYKQGDLRAMILVEGHMDVVSLYQAGIQNAVASMGTSLTIEQCREIKRYADLVYVSYDGDSAGQHATLRGLDMLKSQGLDVKVVCLKDGLDPDDYVRKYGKDSYLQLLNDALPLVDYKLLKIEEQFDLRNPDERIKYAKAAIEVLDGLDHIEREVYSKLIAEKSGLEQGFLSKLLNNTTENSAEILTKTTVKKEEQKSDGNDMLQVAEVFAVSSFIYCKPYVKLDEIAAIKDYLSQTELRQIVEYFIKSILEKKTVPKVSAIFHIIENDELANSLINIVDSIKVENQSDYYNQCITRITENYKKQELKRLVTELSQATNDRDRQIIKEKIKNITKAQSKND